MNKKIIILLFIFLFLIVGCGNSNVEKIENLSFDKLSNAQSTKKDNGTFESGSKWESIRYRFDGMIISVTCYYDTSFKTYEEDEKLEDKKIGKVTYRYQKSKIIEYDSEEYYVSDNKNVYYISIMSDGDKENSKLADNFMKSISIKNEKK